MTQRLPTSASALLVLLCACQAVSPTSAQTRSAAIECTSCGLSGQKPAPATVGDAQVTVVPAVKPVFFQDQSPQGELIGRVVQVSPLTIEMLDTRDRLVDRNLRTVASGGDDDLVCHTKRIERVDLASKAIVSSLRFNDIISGVIVFHEDADRPENILEAKEVLTAVRRVPSPVSYFHTPALKGCANRSGRVLEYRGETHDAVTVFNDGRIVYRNPQSREFTQERLTDVEFAELMRAFASANFDALTADAGRPEAAGGRPGITLIAARYQDVSLAGSGERLAPLVARMKELAARATSRTYFLLKSGPRQPLTILPWPYPHIRLAGFNGYRDRARTPWGSSADNLAPDARDLAERLPAAFVARLPRYLLTLDTSGDPNRHVYFSEDGALYRVRIHTDCVPPDAYYCGTFYALEVDPIPEIDIELLPAAERTYRLMRASGYVGDSDADRTRLLANVASLGLRAQNRLGTYVWTTAMGFRLADLPPTGARIERDEYERHKDVYVAIQKFLETGFDLIEDGVVFEHVRVCQIEPGVVDTCR